MPPYKALEVKASSAHLKALLDDARDAYGGKLKVANSFIDITPAFHIPNHDWTAPKSWGNVGRGIVVAAYVVKGVEGVAPFISKYEKPSQDSERLKLKPLSLQAELAVTLCMAPVESTTFHEVREPIVEYGVPFVQGFSRKVVDNLESMLIMEADFNPTIDSCFMFAYEPQTIFSRVRLNQMWFSQILQYGSGVLNKMGSTEAVLFEKVFGRNWLGGMLRDFRQPAIAEALAQVMYRHDWGRKQGEAGLFPDELLIFYKTIAYIRAKGLKPTLYVPNEDRFVELKQQELESRLGHSAASREITSRPGIKPFSFTR